MTEEQQDPGVENEVELTEDEQNALENPQVADSNDEEDVPAALQRETDDGKGGAVVPKGDFKSFAGEDVENDDPDADNEPDTED